MVAAGPSWALHCVCPACRWARSFHMRRMEFAVPCGTVVRTVLRAQGTSEVLGVRSWQRIYLAGEAAQPKRAHPLCSLASSEML
jgi:hypothetical protein